MSKGGSLNIVFILDVYNNVLSARFKNKRGILSSIDIMFLVHNFQKFGAGFFHFSFFIIFCI